MKQLLKGGTVVSGNGCTKADILIENGKIAEVSPGINAPEAECTDVSGKLLFPGFIDAHTHFDLSVAGTTTADNFESGTRAAVSGGTTLIIDFATQYKGETLKEGLDNWHKKADGNSFCDYSFHLAISEWNDAVSKEIEDIVKSGTTSFKLYMIYSEMLTDGDIYRVLKRLKEVGGIAGVHCENSELVAARTEEIKKTGRLTPASHPVSRPPAVEAEAVNRLLKTAKLADAPVIVVHMTSGEAFSEVVNARNAGQEVYVETCPQYLILDDSRYDLPGFEGSKYIISPPLRRREDAEVLWKALGNGSIQTIATDHCSFTMKQKEMGKDDFTKIPGGMPGTESRAALIYTYGVTEKRITLEQMCCLLSENPAKLYGAYPQKGCLEPGSDADIVVWNPDAVWTMTKDNQVAAADYNPYEGFEVTGIAEKVFLRGELVAENGTVTDKKHGRYVPRKKYENSLL